MLGVLIGLAICFGLTYFLSKAECTADLREGDGELAGFFRTPEFVGMLVAGVLSFLFSPSIALTLLDIGIGCGIGFIVRKMK